jgi:hypothetical protein
MASVLAEAIREKGLLRTKFRAHHTMTWIELLFLCGYQVKTKIEKALFRLLILSYCICVITRVKITCNMKGIRP